jgi:hypothetical protein
MPTTSVGMAPSTPPALNGQKVTIASIPKVN